VKAAILIVLAVGCGDGNLPPDDRSGIYVNNSGLDGSVDGANPVDGPNAALSCSDLVLSFGTVLVDSRSAGLTATIANQGGPSVISGLVISGSGANDFVVDDETCLGVTVTATSTCTARVRFSPTAVGSSTATLTVNGSATGTTSVGLKGAGAIAGALAFTPPNGAFNNVTANTSANVILALQNVGATPTGDITVDLSGPDLGLFQVTANNCAGLAPLGTCSLTVTFSPVNPGARTATLSVSDAFGGTMTAALTGTGI